MKSEKRERERRERITWREPRERGGEEEISDFLGASPSAPPDPACPSSPLRPVSFLPPDTPIQLLAQAESERERERERALRRRSLLYEQPGKAGRSRLRSLTASFTAFNVQSFTKFFSAAFDEIARQVFYFAGARSELRRSRSD